MTECLVGKKEKWTNKGSGKQQVANSLIRFASFHTQRLYQILKPRIKSLQTHYHPYGKDNTTVYTGVLDRQKERQRK